VANSWLHLTHNCSDYVLDKKSIASDSFGARDCGWVEQMRPFVRQFSHDGDVILDPFCGFASTLVAAELEGRKGLGVEVEPSRVNIARERLASLGLNSSRVVEGDAGRIQTLLGTSPCLVDLVLSNIPYFGCHWSGDTRGQLYAVPTYEEYLQEMRACFRELKNILKPSGYIILMVENIRIGDHFVALAADILRLLQERFLFVDERIIVYDSEDQNENEVLGNRAHEHVLIAQHIAKPIDTALTRLYLEGLSQTFPAIIVYGSFAQWLFDQSRQPSDVDIMLPYDLRLIESVVDWFMTKGFKVSRWGTFIEPGCVKAAIPGGNYFRAEYLDAEGRLMNFDISFSSENTLYKMFEAKAIQTSECIRVVREAVNL